MLTGITTRRRTPQEDAAPWPGGSLRPALGYLTGPAGMSETDARELLKAARGAQAEAGPGWLMDYPLPGGDAHLLIHYAPGSRAYRFNLTGPAGDEAPGIGPEPGTAPGNHPGPRRPSRGRETPGSSPAGDAGGTPAPGRPAPGGAAQPGPTRITVTIWHNVAFDGGGRHSAMLDGYQDGDPVVRVFTYQADPAGRTPEEIADEAFDTFNDHPRDPDGADLACAYYGRRLRSLSFPGNWPWCGRSCCVRCCVVLPRIAEGDGQVGIVTTSERRNGRRDDCNEGTVVVVGVPVTVRGCQWRSGCHGPGRCRALSSSRTPRLSWSVHR